MTFPEGDGAAGRADANACGKTKRGENGGLATSTDLAATVPGCTGDKLPQESLADDPDGLTAQGTTAASRVQALNGAGWERGRWMAGVWLSRRARSAPKASAAAKKRRREGWTGSRVQARTRR